jgi:replication factor A1
MASLAPGTVHRMVNMMNNKSDPSYQPLLQIIHLKPVGGAADRYRMVLSDGQTFVQAMLATQLNNMVQSNEIQLDSIIRVKDFMTNNVNGKTVVIVLETQVEVAVSTRIGVPEDYEKNPGGPPAAAAASAQPLYQQPLNNSTNNTSGYNGNAPVKSSPSNPYSGGGGSPGNPYRSRPSSSSQSHAPIMRAEGQSAITPIGGLNMYNNRWTIKARLTSKSDVRTWSNAKGEGSLFSAELLDSSCDIRCTFFKEAVDKFYTVLEVGKVYTFSGGRLKVANMQWNTCKSPNEITFDQNSEIHLENDAGDIQRQTYNFVKIADVEAVEAGKMVDVLAVVKFVGEPANLISKKNGQELTKCDATLVDDSGVEITLTTWGEKAKRAPSDLGGNPVVAFRHARVSDFGGKSLSAGDSIEISPDIPEAQTLQTWWTTQGSTGAVRSLSSSRGGGGKMANLVERKSIASIKEEHLGQSEQPDWISFKATVGFIKKGREGGDWYCACPNAGEPCKNRYKVTMHTDNSYYCEKCQGSFETCVRRWIFSGLIEDDTSSTWVSFFNEQAETLLGGVTADDAYEKTQASGEDQEAYNSYFVKPQFSEWVFKCKVKNEMVNEEARTKATVYSMHPLDYVKESKEMLAEIAKF